MLTPVVTVWVLAFCDGVGDARSLMVVVFVTVVLGPVTEPVLVLCTVLISHGCSRDRAPVVTVA